MLRTLRGSFSLVSLCSLFALSTGCGDGDIGGQPCEGNDVAEECNLTCAGNESCPPGFYCDTDGTCNADCTQGGSECGDGMECSANGQCVSSNMPDAGGCARVDVDLDPQIPMVVLLIDQSGSMTADFGGPTRWEAVYDALVDGTSGVVKQLEASVTFGATLYTSENGNAGGVCPMLQAVAPALNNYVAIEELLRTNSPASDTPTAESVDGVVATFPATDQPRVLVLATDGNPDNCEDASAHNAYSQMLSESAVQNAFTAGIETFVLSVGDQVSQTHLERLARAGRGQPLDSGTAQPFVANSPAELAAAFGEIISGVRSCQLEVDGTVDLSRADEGTVVLNGTELVFGTDWQMADENTLELIGAACDTFLNAEEVVLAADFPCGVVVL